jgi:peptidoglycan lytic transglycosylase D
MKDTHSDTDAGTHPRVVEIKIVGGDVASRFFDSLRIGRASDNQVVIEDEAVSAYHAEVALEDDAWWLHDLASTTGTIVAGKRIDRIRIDSPVRVRLGDDGPSLVIIPDPASGATRDTTPSELRESFFAERIFGDVPPEDMGAHTAMMRTVVKKAHKKRVKHLKVALAMLAVLAVGASAYAYFQWKQILRQRAAAADLFYSIKTLELEVAKLQVSAAERQSYRVQREELEQRYRDYLEELGIYSDHTSEEDRIIYQVVHRLGESEVNVPRDFVREVHRFVERWHRTGRLDSSIARSRANNYGPRIAAAMLEHDIPPEFFYLALQESDLKVEAVGRPTRFGIAKGMWQFIPGTAREMGLRIGPLVGVRRPDPRDERHDFAKSTAAAARYLRQIYTTDAQASGLLVIASYNWGQTNILRLIRSLPENPRDRNFWKLLSTYREQFPRETYYYVLSIVAAAVIGDNPSLFGFDFDPPLPPTDTLVAEGLVAP